jgi:SAM-dependent methyltransferase
MAGYHNGSVPEPLLPALARLRTDLLDAERLVRAVAAGRRKGEWPAFRRVELRWVDLRDGRLLQVVTYDERQAFTRNVSAGEALAAIDELLAQPYGNWHVDTVDGSVQLRVTKSGDAQVHRATSPPRDAVDRSHDRSKRRLIEPADPVLRAVGISDRDGRIKPSRRDKHRQVEEFLRALDPVLGVAMDAAGDGAVRVADLGCGNAYLTFAAYRWLELRGVPAELTGVDVRPQARERNARLAESLGWSATVGFVESSIDAAELPPPHMVLALHACDTATDDALARAVRWQVPVVLAAPCCHHDVQRQLSHQVAPLPYGALTRHGILRERFADVLTDAVRASLMRLLGYRVEVVEFVDSVHTPRNTLLRAVRTGAEPEPGQIREYRELIDQWTIQPALAERLADQLAPALRRDPTDG